MHFDADALIPISEVPKHLPLDRRGKRVHLASVHRWIHKGVAGRRLPAIKIGGRVYVHSEALHRFLVPVGIHGPAESTKAPFQAQSRASRVLDQARIGGRQWKKPA